jgi:SAM-dependent methyltransferase
VLDVGSGLGGPARVLAAEFGCSVTTVDLTPSYVEAARMLTARLGLEDRIRHEVGDALALPFGDDSFDVVWTQNSGMNIADKATLYRGFRRVLRTGGTLAQQEPMAGPAGPVHLPLMWADDPADSYLLAPEEVRQLIETAGFAMEAWEDVTDNALQPGPELPPHSVQRLVMGDRLDDIMQTYRRNLLEGRMRLFQGVFRAVSGS